MRLIVLLGIGLGLGSCATVFNHPVQRVNLTPQFPGGGKAERVRVLILGPQGTYRVTLPAEFAITPDLWTHVTVQVVEPCLKHAEQALARSITPWFWADVLGIPVMGGFFALAGDGLDGTIWSYDREVKVAVEPVADYAACVAESRKAPAVPFPMSRDALWEDPRAYPRR